VTVVADVSGWSSGLAQYMAAAAHPQPAPPVWVAAATALLASVGVAHAATWRVLRHVVTIAHEGGHALVAVSTGRRLRGIRLHSDTSGLTLSSGRPRGAGMIATAFSGYVAPSLIGLLGAGLLGLGRIALTLWAAVLLLAGLLPQLRNLFGIVSVAVTSGVLIAVAVLGSPLLQAIAAYALVWFLLLAGPRPVLEMQRLRRSGRAPTSDADQLARLTRVPGVVWVVAFVVVTCTSAAAGAFILFLRGR
jgi:hypothetical protein